jgi:hypothetical protein
MVLSLHRDQSHTKRLKRPPIKPNAVPGFVPTICTGFISVTVRAQGLQVFKLVSTAFMKRQNVVDLGGAGSFSVLST